MTSPSHPANLEAVRDDADLFPLFKPQPPFMAFPGGHGYLGVIMESRKTGKIQCHICGEMFQNVGRHSALRHGVISDEYRKMAGLNKTVPLVCEATSERKRQEYLRLPPGQHRARMDKMWAGARAARREGRRFVRTSPGSIQHKNQFGTCDLQAKTLFWEEHRALGRIPTTREMSDKLRKLIYSRFGSCESAMRAWGVRESEIIESQERSKQTIGDTLRENARLSHLEARERDESGELVNAVRDFYRNNGRLPSWSEAKRAGMPHPCVFKRVFGSNKKQFILEALLRMDASLLRPTTKLTETE